MTTFREYLISEKNKSEKNNELVVDTKTSEIPSELDIDDIINKIPPKTSQK